MIGGAATLGGSTALGVEVCGYGEAERASGGAYSCQMNQSQPDLSLALAGFLHFGDNTPGAYERPGIDWVCPTIQGQAAPNDQYVAVPVR